MALTPKQQRFVEEYLIDLNATRAAKAAGYSEKSAHSIGQENLIKPEIAAAIQEAFEARSKRTQITADRVLEELSRLAFSNMQDFVEWGPNGVSLKFSEELTEDAARCVAEVSESRSDTGGTIRFKLHNKLGALEKAMQHLGMLKGDNGSISDLPVEKVIIELHSHETLEAPFPEYTGEPHNDGDLH